MEVMFVKVKQRLLDHAWTYPLAAHHFDRWMKAHDLVCMHFSGVAFVALWKDHGVLIWTESPICMCGDFGCRLRWNGICSQGTDY